MTAAVFAIPGDINRRTGGYIYERRLLEGLRGQGRAVQHLALGASFPDPTPADMAEALRRLGEVPAHVPVILDGFLSGTLETAALAALRPPLVALVHHPLGLETGLSPERARFLLRREAANLAHVRQVVVPSPHTAAVLAADFGVPSARITVAPPGFDRTRGQRLPARPPLILSVGILHPRKGHDVLIDALARLADLDWQAAIVGGAYDAPYAAMLAERVQEAGLAGRVRFEGEVDGDALQALYRSATLLALATRYEGYGMVFGEALRHGLPIVSCRAGAVPDTVPAAAGLLVPPDDPAAFANALRRVLVEPETRQALAAGAAAAGQSLPEWSDTARIVGDVLDRVGGGE